MPSAKHIFRPRLGLLQGALLAALSTLAAGGAHAAANNWTGANGTDILDGANWSAGVSPGAGSAPSGAGVVNLAAPAPFWDGVNGFGGQYGLYVGRGGGKSGTLNITLPTSVSNAWFSTGNGVDTDLLPLLVPYQDPTFRIGDTGGTGTVNMDFTSAPAYASVPRIGLNQGLGIGTNGTGTMNVLGSGKTVEQMGYYSPNSVFTSYPSQNSVIGENGGTGTLKLQGAALIFGQPNNGSNAPPNFLNIGTGNGSRGTVNVLEGGKISAATSNSGDQLGPMLPFSFIGKGGGSGNVTLQPIGGNGIRNQAGFHTGLAVGSTGGQGRLDVLAGGKALIDNGNVYGSCNNNTQPYPAAPPSLQIGDAAAGSSGIVRASGANTELLVAGKTTAYWTQPTEAMTVYDYRIGSVGISGGGALVTAVDGVVKVGAVKIGSTNFNLPNQQGQGQYFSALAKVGGLGPVNITGNGGLYYGSEVAGSPVAPGTVQASQVSLGAAASRLVFNHTGNIQFNLPVVGSGQLVQQAGTTTIAATVAAVPVPDGTTWRLPTTADDGCTTTITAPTNQLGFNGVVDVQGGVLVLPVSEVLASVPTFSVRSGGTLKQGGTNQNLGTFTLETGGVLDLTAGAAPGATDTATTGTWTGGGVVQLDTVLNSDASPSDKLVINGAISGTTRLRISNFGGVGALTTGNGILVVQGAIDGKAQAAAKAAPASSFVLDAPVVVNSIEYTLHQVANNWYLKSGPYVPPQPTVVQPVPAMSGLGLLGMGGLLTVVAAALARRRSPVARKR